MKNLVSLKFKIWELAFFLWFLIWVLYHIYTIRFSPLPWWDEVFFADIADSINETGKMYLRLSLYQIHREYEFLLYGPVFFYIQASLIKLFGLSSEVIRMVNLTSGFAIVFLFLWVSGKFKLDRLLRIVVAILITTDTLFQSNMNGGRYDLFCCLFFYLALFLFIFKRSIYLIPIYGLLFAVSYLTSPRIGVYFLILVILFVYELITSPNRNSAYFIIIQYLMLAVVFLVPVLTWIFTKFNNLQDYFRYVLEIGNDLNLVGFQIPTKYQIPIFSIWLFLFITGMIMKKINFFEILLGIIILNHFIWIREQGPGPYSVMVMPVVYLSIVLTFNRFRIDAFINKLISGLIILVITMNLSILMFKSIILFADKDVRNPKYIIEKLSNVDLKNRNIMASYKYYYIIKDQEGNFISYDYNKRIFGQEHIIELDYLMLSRDELNEFNSKFPDHGFQILPLISKSSKSRIYNLLDKMGYEVVSNYDGYLISLK